MSALTTLVFVHQQPAVLAQRHQEPLQRAGRRAALDAALVVKDAAVARAMVALAGAVDRATEVGAHRRQTAERVALAHEEDPLVLQECHRTVGIIVGLAGLEKLAGFEQHVRYEKAHGSPPRLRRPRT